MRLTLFGAGAGRFRAERFLLYQSPRAWPRPINHRGLRSRRLCLGSSPPDLRGADENGFDAVPSKIFWLSVVLGVRLALAPAVFSDLAPESAPRQPRPEACLRRARIQQPTILGSQLVDPLNTEAQPFPVSRLIAEPARSGNLHVRDHGMNMLPSAW